MRATASQAAPPPTSANADLVTYPPSLRLLGSERGLGQEIAVRHPL